MAFGLFDTKPDTMHIRHIIANWTNSTKLELYNLSFKKLYLNVFSVDVIFPGFNVLDKYANMICNILKLIKTLTI